MKYLSSEPMFFAASTPKVKQQAMIERGGLPAFLDQEDRCSTGKHSLRYGNCLCHLFEQKKPKRNGRI